MTPEVTGLQSLLLPLAAAAAARLNTQRIIKS